MRKIFLLTVSAVCLAVSMSAQNPLFKNDGANLVIEANATLIIEGGFENVNGGTVDNNGTIEVQGNFVNSATWDGADVNTVIFSGANSANVTSGGAVFHHVTMNKASGQGITLLDPMGVKGTLTFQADNNKITLGNNNLNVKNAGTITSFDNNEYVVTNGTGALRKEGLDASETFTYPVGYNATTYNPVILAAQAGHTGDAVAVRVKEHVQEDGLTGADLTSGVADASWVITEDTPGGSNVNMTLQWAAGDELPSFDRTTSAVSKHNGVSWDMLYTDLGPAGGTNPYTRTRNGVTSFSTFAVGSEKEIAGTIEADLVAYLEAVYTSGTNMQTDELRQLDLVPTAEPYTGLGFTFAGFGGDESTTAGALNQPSDGDDGVDWIVVELRDAGNNTNVVASRTAILQRDGDIVDVDGSSMLQIYGVAPGNYYVAVHFRNHLAVMTSAPVSFASIGTFDFTTAAPSAIYGGGAAMKQAADGKNILIKGDANDDGLVNSGDLIATAPQAAIGLSNIYLLLDTNMDGLVNSGDLVGLAPNAAVGYAEQLPD